MQEDAALSLKQVFFSYYSGITFTAPWIQFNAARGKQDSLNLWNRVILEPVLTHDDSSYMLSYSCDDSKPLLECEVYHFFIRTAEQTPLPLIYVQTDFSYEREHCFWVNFAFYQ